MTRRKTISILIFLILKTSISYAQYINCIESSKKLMTQPVKDAIKMVYTDYATMQDIHKEILQVEYKMMADDTILFVVTSGLFSVSLLEKPADCYCISKCNMVYIYSKNYTLSTDTVWLQDLYEKTKEMCIREDCFNVLSWTERTYIYINNCTFPEYDPPVYNYKVYKGKIVYKKEWTPYEGYWRLYPRLYKFIQVR